jgi:hypothetical protein
MDYEGSDGFREDDSQAKAKSAEVVWVGSPDKEANDNDDSSDYSTSQVYSR